MKIKRSNALFNLAYSIYILSLFISFLAVDFGYVKTLLGLITIFLLVLNYVGQNDFACLVSLKHLTLIIIAIAIITIAIFERDYFILVLFLFVINFKCASIREILQVSIFVISICTLLIILCCVMGIFPDRLLQRYGQEGVRHTVGFYHSNALPNIFCYLTVYYYTLKNKLTIKDYIFFQFGGFIIYKFCDSRNGFYSLQIFLILLILYQVIAKTSGKMIVIVRKTVCVVAKYAYIFVSIFSVVILQMYRNNSVFAVAFNELVTGRIRLARLYFDSFHIKLFSLMTYNDFISNVFVTIDNGYYYIIARYGIMYIIFFALVTYMIGKYYQESEEYFGLIGLVVLAATNFIDNGFLSYQFYPFLLIGLYEIYYHTMIHFNKNDVKLTQQYEKA